ncbi:Glucuronide carrier protein [Bifidobacterium margollesii]|uniref:Glucuronide carrier protein n=1 Tax=Bifidobacterium margollesii TaxID=2020964 RepID=A0A2N5JAC9_9BIFI|nr:MFS transporter [Bifidobacterium margollesii]PLS31176.1 Glucuronide carrier protein [Bifidobacterium margollesii]
MATATTESVVGDGAATTRGNEIPDARTGSDTRTGKGSKPPQEGKRTISFGKMLVWQSRGVSYTVATLILGYLTIYCTDTLHMPAAIVGSILLVSKLFDGVIDLVGGYLVDRTNTRWGRGRPYEWCIIGVWLFTWLMYSTPESFALPVKVGWIFVMYTMVNSLFNTFLNCGNVVYMVRAFPRKEDYTAINTWGGTLLMIPAVVFNVAFPTLMAKFAISPQGWSSLVGMFALPLAVIGIMRFVFIKEVTDADVQTHGEKTKFRDVLSVLRHNGYIYIIAFATFVFNIIINMGVQVYYFKHIVGDLSAMSILNAVMIVGIPLAFLYPAIIRRTSTTKLMIGFLFLSCIGYGINWFAYDNVPMLIVGGVLASVGSSPIAMVVALLIIDCADYNEWKGIPRMEGTLSAINSFAAKIGSGLGAGLLGVLLGMAHYDTANDSQAVPQSGLDMIRMLYTIVPLVMFAVVAFILCFYKLDREIAVIRADNEARRKEVEAEMAAEAAMGSELATVAEAETDNPSGSMSDGNEKDEEGGRSA